MKNRDQGSGSRDQGFTLIELLIAMGITLAIGGAVAALANPARMAFERVPADLETEQRGRMALELISQTVRAAGRDVAVTHALGAMAGRFPAVTLSDPDETGTIHRSLTAIVPVADPAQGVLEIGQASGSSSITLAIAGCPNVKEVCGFTTGAAAVILDAAGHFDVFVVASTNAGARRLTPDRTLSRAYDAGSVVVEIDQSTFRLDEQADGSLSLIRVTAAGAVQPVVDCISSLSFSIAGRQLEMVLTVQAVSTVTPGASGDRLFRTSVRMRNAS